VADIVIDELSAIQRQDGVAMRSELGVHEELAGHAEMDREAGARPGKVDQDKLAVPANTMDCLADDSLWLSANNTGAAELRGQNTPPGQARRQTAYDGFDFG
jgi:hypothetical protein